MPAWLETTSRRVVDWSIAGGAPRRLALTAWAWLLLQLLRLGVWGDGGHGPHGDQVSKGQSADSRDRFGLALGAAARPEKPSSLVSD